ncbi:M56 family metallopeptidase [Massilia sp. LXY-6]|uniref:M56 family metallopeptidase n=1 Tax=Massilia sp. LXY-6 TaxID=3379823 RepID=UPI003EE0A0F1
MSAAAGIAALAWALLDFVWQGALVGCAAAVLLGLLGRARPQWRYLLACGALLLCAALPLAGMLAAVLTPMAGQGADGAAFTLPSSLLQALRSGVARDAAWGLADRAALPAAWDAAGWREALRPRLPLVILCWSGGAALMALRLLLGLAWVRRRSRPDAYRHDPAWQAVLDRLAAQLGIGRKVILGLVDELASPVTAGALAPLVLVPAALATGMAPQLLEALLAHELAHVRRHDYLLNLVQSAIEILLFYHPAVWWLSHRIRVERELIADDLAASALGEPRRLALALSELDLFQLSTTQLAPGASGVGGNLMSRIKRLVRPQAEALDWKLALPALGLALTAALHAHAGTAPAAPAAAQEKPAVHVTLQESRGDAYALVGEGDQGFNMTGNSADWPSIKQLKRSVKGEFLWFRDGGKSWIVQDPDTLAKAHAAWAPVNRLGEQMNAYGKEMDQHGKAMDALGKQMEQAAGAMRADQPRVRELERKMNELGRQMGALGEQMGKASSDSERKRLDEKMHGLDQRMRELGEQMRAAHESEGQRRAGASMDEIGKRMDEAGKPMDALGKKMDALGKQMDRESKAADKTMRGLIRDAIARGLAQQAPVQG